MMLRHEENTISVYHMMYAYHLTEAAVIIFTFQIKNLRDKAAYSLYRNGGSKIV